MPRTQRYDKINSQLLREIENLVVRLESRIGEGEAWLVPFNPQYNALGTLREDLRRALNLLNDRPADWERPHHAPMSQSTKPG